MKTRKTTAPIPIDQIKEYFTDKELFFVVDYHNSELRDKVFLTYLSNLDLPSDIENVEPDELFSLVEAYMTIKTVNNTPYLNMVVAHIILKAKGSDTSEILNPIITDEVAQRFIDGHEELVSRWLHFINSTMLYLIYIYTELNEKVKVEETVPSIDDADYVGLNIVNLFLISGFMESYFTVEPQEEMHFFTKQFTEHMFRGKSFFSYYNNPSNMFIPLLIALVEGQISINPADIFPADVIDKIRS